MIRKPTRAQVVAAYRARFAAAREAKEKEARRVARFRAGGGDEMVFGRILAPGETPSALGPSPPRWPWEDGR